jgi:ADP-glucose pyrophosphorylase
MSNAEIGPHAEIDRAIVGEQVVAGAGCRIGFGDADDSEEISVVPEGLVIPSRPRSIDVQCS